MRLFISPHTDQILKSAYRVKNRSEPIYTNHIHTDLSVEDVLELTDKPTSESYPDEIHPFDHLMIAATFRLS